MPRLLLLFSFMVAFGCFYGLGSYGILDNNEGLYAFMSSEMARSGDWIIPRLNGVEYFEKPPMLYWLTALSLQLFGHHEWAARLPVALATAGTALTMQLFLKHLGYRRSGLIAGIILVSSPILLIIGRTIYCDMLLTFFVTLALVAFYHWLIQQKTAWLVLCHASIGCAVLSKGFIAVVLCGAVALVFMLMEKMSWRIMLKAFHPLAVAAFLIVVLPWHIAASLKDPDFAEFYFINEHINRFFGTRQPFDYYRGPIWFYIPRIAGYLFPWILLIPLLRFPARTPGDASQVLNRFLWCWFLVLFCFFSIARAKANYYMVVGMPPLIMLLSLELARRIESGELRFIWTASALAALLSVIIVSIGLPVLVHLKSDDYIFLKTLFGHGAWYPLGLSGFAGAVLLYLSRRYRYIPAAPIGLMCIPCLIFLPLLVLAAHKGESYISQKQPAQWILSNTDSSHVAILHDFEEISALPYYMGEPVTIVDSASADLLFGQQRGQRNDLFPLLPDWLIQNGKDHYLVVRKQYITQLQKAMQTTGVMLCQRKTYPRITIWGACA